MSRPANAWSSFAMERDISAAISSEIKPALFLSLHAQFICVNHAALAALKNLPISQNVRLRKSLPNRRTHLALSPPGFSARSALSWALLRTARRCELLDLLFLAQNKKGAPKVGAPLDAYWLNGSRLAGTSSGLVHAAHAAATAWHTAAGACALLLVFLDIRH
jgi:hypothetical protein